MEENRTKRLTGRALSGLVIAFMLLDGSMKLVPLDEVLQASEDLGLPTTAGFARLLGAIGLLATALYAWPRTAVLGAVLLTAYMGGAIVTHLRVGSPLATHVLFGVYLAMFAWGGLYFRDPRLRTLFPVRQLD